MEVLSVVDRTCCAQFACAGSTCLGATRPARHAPAAPMRQALPVAQSIRLALRLHALAPKVAGPEQRCRQLLSLTPRGGSRRSVRLRAQTSRARAEPYGRQRVLPRCLDLCGVEEVPGEIGAQRQLEAAHGRQGLRAWPTPPSPRRIAVALASTEPPRAGARGACGSECRSAGSSWPRLRCQYLRDNCIPNRIGAAAG